MLRSTLSDKHILVPRGRDPLGRHQGLTTIYEYIYSVLYDTSMTVLKVNIPSLSLVLTKKITASEGGDVVNVAKRFQKHAT